MKVSPLAGKPADASMLVNVPRLVTAYYTEIPDPSVPGQRVSFGTSGHRRSAFEGAFNEWHDRQVQSVALGNRPPVVSAVLAAEPQGPERPRRAE